MKSPIYCVLNFVILIILMTTVAENAAAQNFDNSFKPAISGNQGGAAIRLRLSDGRLVLTGDFRLIGGVHRTLIAILYPDGTVDNSFEAGEFTNNIPQASTYISNIDMQSDGKLLIYGAFTHINGVASKNFVRLNSNGAVDPTFNIGQGFNSSIYNFKVLPSGKILVSGLFNTFNGQPVPPIVRLNPDGSLDTSFTAVYNYGLPFDTNFVVQPDGKIIVTGDIYSISTGGFQGIARINENGSMDNSFNPGTGVNNYISTMLLQPDGKLLIGGSFTTYNGTSRTAVARINPNGSLDTSFVANTMRGSFGSVPGFSLQSNNQIIMYGGFDTINNITRKRIARLNTDGSIDQSFAPLFDIENLPAGIGSVSSAIVLPDQKIVISGNFYMVNQTIRLGLAKLNTDGTLDDTFTPSARDIGVIYSIVSQPDGKKLVGGLFSQVNGKPQFGIARLNADGTVDPNFNSGTGLLNLNPLIGGQFYGSVNAITLQQDGKILIGGDFSVYNNIHRNSLARLNADGTLDTSFPNNTLANIIVYNIVVQPDNKILVARSNGLVRFNPDGTPDAGFNAGTINNPVRTIALQPDGKIIIGGLFTSVSGTPRNRIARLNSNGSLDTGFNTSVGANGAVLTSALQADGKVLAGGAFTSINGTNRNQIARLNPDGTVDTAFDPGAGADSQVNKVLVQPNGKILIGGSFNNFAGIVRRKVAQLFPNGTLDTSFGASINFFSSGSSNAVVYDFLKTDSALIVGGNITNVNNQKVSGIAKFSLTRSPFDFDGDSKTDISIFRPAAGEWWYLKSSTGGNTALQFGSSTDRLVPGDFTGDGKTDIAFWRPATGEWYVLRSEDNSFFSFPFGTSGDVPAPADYDGDGKTDAAVFRPSTSTWFILNSGGGTSIVNFGAAEDKPVPADYDGDGKADVAIFRPSDGSWWCLRSSDSQFRVFRFGLGTDKPVQGDYTGDGKADLAVFRPSTGEWFVQRSEDNSYYSVPFGAAGDIPTPGDYDGDGKFDTAVFRPSVATWFLNQTTAGVGIVNFGSAGDFPVPNAFVP
jgi:uncharacterized delta-60 repeat protein